jgi:hypothetical protein
VVTQENALIGRAINIFLGSIKKFLVKQNATLDDTDSEETCAAVNCVISNYGKGMVRTRSNSLAKYL